MKSTRRHELQHNALDAELGKTVEFFRLHGMKVAWGVLIVVALGLLLVWHVNKRSNQRGQILANYAAVNDRLLHGSAESVLPALKELIDQDIVPRIAALACVDAGDVCAAGLQAAKDAPERDKLAQQARGYYRMAIDKHADEPLAVAKAHLGLAAVAEGLGDSAKEREENLAVAKAEYEAAKAMAGYPAAILADAAQRNLPLLAEPVKLATTMPAEPEETPEPETEAPEPATETPATTEVPEPATEAAKP